MREQCIQLKWGRIKRKAKFIHRCIQLDDEEGRSEAEKKTQRKKTIKKRKNREESCLPKTVPPTKRNAWLHDEIHALNVDQPDNHPPAHDTILLS